MNRKKNTFHVIGGQDAYVYYGRYDTLRQARRAADTSLEYWGREYGLVAPKIYQDKDVEMVTGIITTITSLSGPVKSEVVTIIPVLGAKPVRYEKDL